MPGNPKLIIDIITDASKANKGLDQATSGFGKFNAGMNKLVAPAAAVLGGITALGAAAVNSASDLQQAAGGTEAVFGKSAAQIQKWASTAADSVGLSSAAYQTFAAKIGAQLKNAGVPMDAVAGKTDEMIRLGADLAATYGGTTAEAVDALGAAFRGEADPAERYGLALNQTAVKAQLAAKGQDKLTGSALTAAKAQAVMELATKGAGGAIGQFGRESDTVAGQQQRLAASMEDMSATLGTALLPILEPVIAALVQFAHWVQQNSTLVGIIIGVIAALAAIILVYAAAQAVANAVMLANPVGLLIAAVVLLIAAIAALVIWVATHTKEIGKFFSDAAKVVQVAWAVVVAWFKSVWASIVGWFRGIITSITGFFSSAWNSAVSAVSSIIRTLQGVFTSVFNAIMRPIKAVIGFFGDIVSAIQNVISWLGRIKIPDIAGAIGGIFGGGRSATGAAVGATAAGVPLFTGRGLAVPSPRSSGAGTGGGTVINVAGGIDTADMIARKIEAALTARSRRTGGVTITRSRR